MKFYVRERQKVGAGVKQPKFRVVAVTGEKADEGHLKVEAVHFRKNEIEAIARDVGAEIVWLEPMPEEERGSMKEE
ncbi:hypothetical protein [Methanofollis fontis]|uniref:Uncharacterized protein n=1 Tax=Methanofollis fontis TaxID=2052832 RepID=A0A483CVQ8_9EURY|nr:hypothetical protein [Methanofollis fontis]TAJ43560.1 hypothetical protein CUJ86_10545 [Methanofollis fontis]